MGTQTTLELHRLVEFPEAARLGKLPERGRLADGGRPKLRLEVLHEAQAAFLVLLDGRNQRARVSRVERLPQTALVLGEALRIAEDRRGGLEDERPAARPSRRKERAGLGREQPQVAVLAVLLERLQEHVRRCGVHAVPLADVADLA